MMQPSEAPAAHPALPDFKPETIRGAAGYFRVGQTRAGEWWFIDPRDEAFFSCGVNAVTHNGGTRAEGAEPADAVATARVRLNAWRINSLGVGSGADLCDRGTADIALVEFAKVAPETLIKGPGARVPDVFAPRWIEACDRAAAERCGARALSRDLIGYCTDDELGWAQPSHEGDADGIGAIRAGWPTLLQICLSLEPSFPAYHAAWEFTLAAHGGELANLARAWGADLPNKQTLRQLTMAEQGLVSAGYLRDQERFAREFARRYFAVTAAAIRRHDPHHLVLGCRFAGGPGAAILAECAWPGVDVLSVNPGGESLWAGVEVVHGAQGMPVLVGEFGWTGEAFTGAARADEPRGQTTVERMLARGRAALERGFTHPALVGYAWPQWADRSGDRPPFGGGLLHVDDREAREHTELLADLNTRATALRLEANLHPKP